MFIGIKRIVMRSLVALVQRKNRFFVGNNKNINNWKTIAPIEVYNTPSIKCPPLPVVYAHSFWHGLIGRKQLFSLKSFLCTQNMDDFEIWLWLDNESMEINKNNEALNNLVALSRNKIVVKEWDVHKEIMDTKLSLISWSFKWDRPLPAVADDFRVIALHKYGGLYFDLDVMFCRDFRPLLMRGEFTYAWEKQPYANSALLFLTKQSYLSDMILKTVRRRLSSTPWVVFRYDNLALKKMTVYPCAMFDPLWNGYCDGMPIKEFSDFFKEFDDNFIKDTRIKSYKDFFSGIYAYHWHNKWDCQEYENSYFGTFEKEFNELLGFKTLA